MVSLRDLDPTRAVKKINDERKRVNDRLGLDDLWDNTLGQGAAQGDKRDSELEQIYADLDRYARTGEQPANGRTFAPNDVGRSAADIMGAPQGFQDSPFAGGHGDYLFQGTPRSDYGSDSFINQHVAQAPAGPAESFHPMAALNIQSGSNPFLAAALRAGFNDFQAPPSQEGVAHTTPPGPQPMVNAPQRASQPSAPIKLVGPNRTAMQAQALRGGANNG